MKKKDIMAIVAVALMAVACNQHDDGLRQEDRVPIRLSASVEGSKATLTRTGTTDDNTQDTELLEGQAVDAYIKVKGGSWLAQPLACTVTGTSGDLTYSGDCYYPMDATPVTIYAVHPSIASAADFTVSTDQTDADNYAYSDLCYSKTADYDRQEAAQTLTFSHVMSKIIVNVDVSGLSGSPTVSDLKLRAKTKTAITYPTGSGDDYSLGTAATPAYISMNEGGAVIIPPQTTADAGDVRISFEVDGIGLIVYDFPASTEFASNTEYTITVRVGASITVTSSISSWGSGGTNENSVQIGRPKLPIEYVIGTHNMANATTMAADDDPRNSGYFYWGSSISARSTEMQKFVNGTVSGLEDYHLPSILEWMAIIPAYWPTSVATSVVDIDGDTGERVTWQNEMHKNMTETVAWGVTNNNGVYSYDVKRSFSNDYNCPNDEAHRYIGYGLRFKELDGKNGIYTCAYRYEYIIPSSENNLDCRLVTKIKYIGFDQSVTIETISDEDWWETSDFELTLPSCGHRQMNQANYPAGTYLDGASVLGSGCYWAAEGGKDGKCYCILFHTGGLYGDYLYEYQYCFSVRLFKNAD